MYTRVACTWNGIHYPSVSAAAKANNIGRHTMLYRLKCGYTCDEDMPGQGVEPKPCIWNGIEYKSIAAAAIANNISRYGMLYRIQRGYTSDSELCW